MEIYSLFTRNVREPGCAVHGFSHVRFIPGWECFHLDSAFVFLLWHPSYWCPVKPFNCGNQKDGKKVQAYFILCQLIAENYFPIL